MIVFDIAIYAILQFASIHPYFAGIQFEEVNRWNGNSVNPVHVLIRVSLHGSNIDCDY